jgi:hypothetical protein
VQVTALPPAQVPPWQVSVCVQELPSLHAVPFAAMGLEHAPLVGSHVPGAWHWSLAAQVTGAAPRQRPAWQVSTWVQTLPSLHALPFGAVGFVQKPLLGSHVPARWH